MTPEDEFRDLVKSWVAQELSALYRQPAPASRGLLIGVAVWGKTFIDRFLRFGARSLAAPRNAATLRHNSRLVLFADGEGFDLLWQYARERQASGFPTQIIVMPDLLMAQLAKAPDNKFTLLGATHILQVQMAAFYGMGYHMSAPDLIYADGYFPGLMYLAQDHKAIAHTNPSAHIGIYDDLPKDGPLALDPEELGALTWKHLHVQSRTNLMNVGAESPGYPPAHFNIWQGRDSLIIHSPHLSATYMAPEVCAKAPVRFFSPIDCQLPFMMPDGFYTPRRQHGMSYIEVSDDSKIGRGVRHDIEIFAAICWHSTRFRDEYLPFYDAASVFPIPVQESFLTDAEIATRHAQVVVDLKALKENLRGRIAFEEAA